MITTRFTPPALSLVVSLLVMSYVLPGAAAQDKVTDSIQDKAEKSEATRQQETQSQPQPGTRCTRIKSGGPRDDLISVSFQASEPDAIVTYPAGSRFFGFGDVNNTVNVPASQTFKAPENKLLHVVFQKAGFKDCWVTIMRQQNRLRIGDAYAHKDNQGAFIVECRMFRQ